MELLQLAGEGRSELLRDDHMLVWEVLHAVWCWFESFFIALTTKWLNHSFYNCWLKVNLQFLFFFVNFFIGILFTFNVILFIDILLFCRFPSSVRCRANYVVALWCAVHVQVSDTHLPSIDEFKKMAKSKVFVSGVFVAASW
jgi:hypothetical protein